VESPTLRTQSEPSHPLLARALERARERSLPYSGALTPTEAYELLSAGVGAVLVDVRTRAELYWVGRVPGSIEIEWNGYPGGQLNPGFLEELASAVPDRSSPVLFLCRSAGRSDHAARAATAAGYRCCINVLEGFEGDRDAAGHRGNLGGWRRAGLPWVQG
jgi:rhodanese-related sulfurtransferase